MCVRNVAPGSHVTSVAAQGLGQPRRGLSHPTRSHAPRRGELNAYHAFSRVARVSLQPPSACLAALNQFERDPVSCITAIVSLISTCS